jgi:hypothetical protein
MGLPIAAPWRSTRPGVARAPLAIASGRLGAVFSFHFMLLAALCVGSFALAVSHPWSHAYIGDAQYGDAAYWDFAGENWARGYVGAKAPDIRPGYSVFLGIVYILFGPRFQNAFVAQSLLYAVGVGMVFAIGRRIGGTLTGLLAGLMLALDPYIWEWNATSTTELLGSIANLGGVWFLIRSLTSRRPFVDVGLFGICLAVANVVRPVTLPFLAPALFVLFLRFRGGWLKRAQLVLVGIGATMLALLPSVAYQYAATGDPGLSSNSAANLYAASSPTYRTWTPAIYDAVAADLAARGVTVTAETVNAEFTRLTILNYVQHPDFQIGRIVDGFHDYGAFEGQTERPDQYTFFRPFVVLGTVALALLLVFARGGRSRAWVGLTAVPVVLVLFLTPAPALVVLELLGLAFGLRAAIRNNPRVTALAVVGLYWLTTGLMAILTTGIAGFFLNRLYTQVEPERVILIAVGALGVSLLPVPGRLRARVLALRWVAQYSPRLPRAARAIPALALVASLLVVLFGGTLLIAANVAPASASETYPVPTSADLDVLAAKLRLPSPPRYLDTQSYDALHTSLVSSKLPETPLAYAVPGQFTRFLWYLSDQSRTLFWFVFADRTRPPSLDRNLLTAEAPGYLREPDLGNKLGLLVLLPTNAYFDATGDVSQQNVLGARAFVPWDPDQHRFRLDAPMVFPLTTPLYDHVRFDLAHKNGSISEFGPVRVQAGDRLIRALEFQPKPDDTTRQASLTYPRVWIPTNAVFHAWISLHPRLFNHADLGLVHVEVRASADNREVTVADQVLDAMDPTQRVYLPLQADVSAFGGSVADLTIRVWGADPRAQQAPDVLIGEPQLIMP